MMEEIKKIFVKAVYGHSTESFSKNIHIDAKEGKKPEEILGTIITNVGILSWTVEENINNGKSVRVEGIFDAHLWYALNGDTKVASASSEFSDIVVIHGRDSERYSNEEVRAWIQRVPWCSRTSITDGPEGPGITATVEYELGAEIMGETELGVKVFYPADIADEVEEIPFENGEIPDEYEDD
jgi:spore coat protein E